MAKEHEQYLRELRRQGYITVRKTRSNHLRIFCPCGCLVSTHSVNGGTDHRGLLNLKSEVKRHELRHRDSDSQAQQTGRGNPVGDSETGRHDRDEPQRAEHQRRDDQHPAKQITVESHW